MNDPLKPSVRFWPYCGVTELEPDVDYAAIYVHRGLSPEVSQISHRPVRAIWIHGAFLLVEDPTAPEDMIRFDIDPKLELMIVGKWNEPRDPIGWFQGVRSITWRQHAAHQLGQVLRQRVLAERLTDFGIPRESEAYLPHHNTSNAVRRSLTLTYDELDKLLRGAGF